MRWKRYRKVGGYAAYLDRNRLGVRFQLYKNMAGGYSVLVLNKKSLYPIGVDPVAKCKYRESELKDARWLITKRNGKRTPNFRTRKRAKAKTLQMIKRWEKRIA